MRERNCRFNRYTENTTKKDTFSRVNKVDVSLIQKKISATTLHAERGYYILILGSVLARESLAVDLYKVGASFRVTISCI